MTENAPLTHSDTKERVGPARDFAAFSELELERRRNSYPDFDPELFRDAVALVLGKIDALGGGGQGGADDDHQ